MNTPLSDPWSRLNLILAVLLIALLAADRWPASTADTERLTQLERARVADIRVERDGRLTLHLQRTAGGWALRYPHDRAARTQRVQQLLAITQAPVQRALGTQHALARYGLEPAMAVVQFDQTRLAFGARDPSQRGRYVLVDGEVRLIDDIYFNLLTLPARHFAED